MVATAAGPNNAICRFSAMHELHVFAYDMQLLHRTT